MDTANDGVLVVVHHADRFLLSQRGRARAVFNGTMTYFGHVSGNKIIARKSRNDRIMSFRSSELSVENFLILKKIVLVLFFIEKIKLLERVIFSLLGSVSFARLIAQNFF